MSEVKKQIKQLCDIHLQEFNFNAYPYRMLLSLMEITNDATCYVQSLS